MPASYRDRRAAGEGGMRTMAIAAAALGGLLLVGMGGWAVMGRRPAAVPLIEADSRPLRVKPENPGGMQIAGADEQVLGGSSGGADKLAPPAEAPAPQALRAQMQQGATPAPPAATPAPVATASAPAPTAGASPLPDTPARPQAARPAAAQSVPAKSSATGTLVQLAAVGSEAAAQAEWQRLAKKMPDLLGDRRLTIQRAESDGRAIWRVRTGGFADVADATGFCARLRAKGGNCAIASF